MQDCPVLMISSCAVIRHQLQYTSVRYLYSRFADILSTWCSCSLILCLAAEYNRHCCIMQGALLRNAGASRLPLTWRTAHLRMASCELSTGIWRLMPTGVTFRSCEKRLRPLQQTSPCLVCDNRNSKIGIRLLGPVCGVFYWLCTRSVLFVLANC